MMKKVSIILILALTYLSARSQSLYFPPLTGDTWDSISPLSLGWCPDKIDTLFNYLAGKNTKAFILLKNGKIVIEKYFGSFTRDSSWYWASAGKTLTAFTVGIAQYEGHLSISDTSSKYLGSGWTSCSSEQEKRITVRQQLTMTSGLDDAVPDHYCTLDTCLKYKADAGTRWAYHNGPYTLLDKVIESATGQTLNVYFTQKVKNPTGITGLFLPSGYNHVFFSKARSMARFGLLILNNGNWNGNQLMKDTGYFNQMLNTSQAFNRSYGYLWWLNGKTNYMVPTLQFQFPGPLCPNAPADLVVALGKNGQLINVCRSQNLVFIRMGEASGTGEVPVSFNDDIWKILHKIMCNSTAMDDLSSGPGELKLYPNPAGTDFHVELADPYYKLRLFDLRGKVIFEKDKCSGKTSIERNTLANGIYFIKVVSSKGIVYHQKLIIK